MLSRHLHEVPVLQCGGSKRAIYCKKHALDGMVNARTGRVLGLSRTIETARDGQIHIESNASASHQDDVVDNSAMRYDASLEMVRRRKRSILDIGGNNASQCKDQNPLKRWGSQTLGIGSSMEIPHNISAFRALRALDDDTAGGNVVKRTRLGNSPTSTPSPDEHCAGKPIKTEVDLVVHF